MNSPDAKTTPARDLWQFDSLTRSLVLGLCLTDEDAAQLVDCSDAATCFTRSPDALRRDRLQGNCRRNSKVCRRVTDLLDLRYVDTVQFVRNSSLTAVTETLDSCLRIGLQAELPALLWAVATDSREEAREVTQQLANEIMARACDIIREVVDFTDRAEY